MPLVERTFFVAVCPNCKDRIDINGEGGFTVFDSKKAWREHLKQMGCATIADYCGCKRRAERKAK